MRPSFPQRALLSALLLTSLATAQQQGVLSDGNSKLPDCAQGCGLLNQAAQACSATNSATQQNWICFCQSAYLTTLKQSAQGICNTVCGTSDNNQIMTWYNSNCGTDLGVSEHPDTGSAATATAANGQTTASGTGTAAASTNTGGSSSNASSGPTCQGWWECHYKWIIMLIVLAVCLPLLGVGAMWLKKRHDRKADQINGGFNQGITTRPPPMSSPSLNQSGVLGAGSVDASGRNSPARTRDAYMPYGYGYSRSQSRLSNSHSVHPAQRGETPDMEKEAGMRREYRKSRDKKVLVREKSQTESSNEGGWM